jgi:hypothetical protein
MFNTADNALLIRLSQYAPCLQFLMLKLPASYRECKECATLQFGSNLLVVSTPLGIYLLLLGRRLYAVVFGWLLGLLISSVAGLILTIKHLSVSGKPHHSLGFGASKLEGGIAHS